MSRACGDKTQPPGRTGGRAPQGPCNEAGLGYLAGCCEGQSGARGLGDAIGAGDGGWRMCVPGGTQGSPCRIQVPRAAWGFPRKVAGLTVVRGAQHTLGTSTLWIWEWGDYLIHISFLPVWAWS